MQEPRPVAQLLLELAAFATTISQSITPDSVDWHKRPQETEWSLTELMCHLRDVEQEVHQPRFRALIAADNAFIPGVNADDWVAQRRYHEQNGRSALQQFLLLRQETLNLLAPLSETIWQRKGRHAFFGPTSLHELLNLAVKHDEAHHKQVEALGIRLLPPS